MQARLIALYRRLGRLERVFLILLAVALVARFTISGSGISVLLSLAAFGAGAVVLFRAGFKLMRLVIWRLRYRLLVAYLFIALVPIVLIVLLVGFGGDMIAGQIATYLVTAELDARREAMLDPARELAAMPAQVRAEQARWMAPYLREKFPGMEMVISGDSTFRFPRNAALQRPAGWGDASGLVLKDGALHLWAHVRTQTADVTMLAPITQDALSELVPNLGELSLMRAGRETVPSVEGEAPKTRLTFRRGAVPRRSRNRVPPPANLLDAEVVAAAPVSVAIWENPGQISSQWMFLSTRYSAVLGTVFGGTAEWAEGLTMFMQALIALLLIVEFVSVYIGVKLTRSITYAVHNLYEGTQRVRVGDFSHRIEVRGTDQLAELGESFNRMTENLERLVDVAKEKERLQSEIEIAREVQNQLFPRSVPVSDTLELAAVCRPARLVSGDYYDYLTLYDSRIAFAIGDVAGKGISAALLMATVQSSMRAQLRAGRELAAAVGGGSNGVSLSASVLVTRLNQQLYAFTPPEKFATFFFGMFDEGTGQLMYTNAGHLPPILVRDGAVTRLEVNGTVVGAFSFAEYEESSIFLKRGDLLVCFTDGITEPENDFGEMFGEERLAEVLVKNAGRPSAEIIEAVLDSVRVWTGSPELQDDMTILLARRV